MARRGRLAQLRADAKRAGWDRFIGTENDERALLAGCTFDIRMGEHVVEFFHRFLRHSKGEWAGQPFILTECQREDIILPLFSWIRPDGRRRFTSADIWVPKKNFKSTMASGLALYGLIADDEPGAEVYCAAVDKKQAGIVFGEAANMVDASRTLRKRLNVVRSTKTINHGTNAWLRALSADYASQEGINAHFRIVDEIHAFDERGRALVETLRYSGAARRQPLGITISTAGDDDASVGYEQHEYAKAVRDGTLEDIHSFVFIAAADADDDPADPVTWAKANPSLGTIIREEELREECEKAINSPRLMASFKRYRLNLWVRTSTPWLPMERWDACAGAVDKKALLGQRCCGGLDLSATTDLTAFVLAFPDEEGETFRLLPFFWLPEEGIARKERHDRVPYRLWAERGFVTLTPGNVVDYGFVRHTIVEQAKKYHIAEVAYDPHNATDLVQRLQDEDQITMVEFRQGYLSMSPASKAFEMAVLGGRLRHGANPILRWMASHTVVREDPAGNIKPDKAKSRHRIDGIVASVMAVSRAQLAKEQSGSLVSMIDL